MSLYKPKRRDRHGVLRPCGVWWTDVVVAGTRYRRSLGVRDKHAAQVLEAELIRKLELEAAGLPVENGTADAKPSVLIGEYERELQRRRCSVVHVRKSIQRAEVLLNGSKRLADVTPAKIRGALDRLSLGEASPRTVNAYRLALSGFFNWLVREGRWPTNPVRQVAAVKVNGATRMRRALTERELARLLDAAPSARALVYRVAATTGLRRGELAALTWADIDLDAATLRVRASTSKNRRDATQPLPDGTVVALATACGERQIPSSRVFASIPMMPTFRNDLDAANIPYESEEGVADFHALRVTYATMLARAGVSLVQAQRLMRHSDPKLTANIYTRLQLDDAHAAVARIDLCTKRPGRVTN